MPVPQLIPHCRMYTEDGSCLSCDPGYFKTDASTCEEMGDANCLWMVPTVCEQCQAGFLVDNGYLYASHRDSFDVFQLVRALELDPSYLQTPHVCQSLNVPYCLMFKNADECLQCDEDISFLDDATGRCVRYFVSGIRNCATHFSLGRCLQCAAGFLLSMNHDACVPIPEDLKLKNCVAHSSSLSWVECALCEDGFYLVFGLCKPVSPIAFCLSYSAHANKCAACEAEYVLDSNQLNCLPTISNCVVYSSTQQLVVVPQLQCHACAPDFALDWSQRHLPAAACVPNASNCELVDGARCLNCADKFYLAAPDNVCARQPQINACRKYSSSRVGVCEECEVSANFLLFNFSGRCQPPLPIANCAVFESSTACAACADYHFMTEDKT